MKKLGCAVTAVIAAVMLAGCQSSAEPTKTSAYASTMEKLVTNGTFTYKAEMTGQVNENWEIVGEGQKISCRMTNGDELDIMFIDDNGDIKYVDYLKKEYGKSYDEEMVGGHFLSMVSTEQSTVKGIISSADTIKAEKRTIDGTEYDCEIFTQASSGTEVIFAYGDDGLLKVQQWNKNGELYETIKVSYSLTVNEGAFEIPAGFTLYEAPQSAEPSTGESAASESESASTAE